MKRIWRGNFDCEYRMQAQDRPLTRSRTLELVNARFASRLLPLTAAGDMLWVPEWPHLSIEEQQDLSALCQKQQVQLETASTARELPSAGWRLDPWGWNNEMRELATLKGWEIHAPSQRLVAWTNSRRTSAQYELEYDIGPPGLGVCTSADELQQILRSCTPNVKWVLKAEFGMSGRERIMGTGSDLSSQQVAWTESRFAAGHALVWEPWLASVGEMSFHYELSQAGEVRFCGVTDLFSDARGQYLRNDAIPVAQWNELRKLWPQSWKVTGEFASSAAQAGYFGPLSIDSMRYADSAGCIHERPLQDVNARWTMGRCILEQFLKSDDSTAGSSNDE